MISAKDIESVFVSDDSLLQRWPDVRLSKSFSELLEVHRKLSEERSEQTGNANESLRHSYETICKWILQSHVESSALKPDTDYADKSGPLTVSNIVLSLRATYEADWLQSVASLLGMLMHFSPGNPEAKLLVNHRRPQKPFSTYPTSPAVAKCVGNAIISYLLKQPIPVICDRYSYAECYAERALTFRVLDPSMESGQLLLEVAFASIRKVATRHSASSKAARHLNRALVEKLCRDCLWGLDRNDLAAIAVRSLFTLVGAEFGIEQLPPIHLVTGDALEHFDSGRLRDFDGVVNNPPWGEALRTAEREKLRGRFSTLEHRSDTYVAFGEMSIRCIRPGGVFGLILPSQVVATRNTARLRELFLNKTELDRMVLLPRSAFADATVRGLVLLGRVQPTRLAAGCRVMTYPVVKRFDAIGPARSAWIPRDALRSVGAASWWPLFNVKECEHPQAKVVRLGQVADVTCGVHMYRIGGGNPPQTARVVRTRPFTLFEPTRGAVPALRGRDVHPFHVGEPRQFVKLGKWLAWAGSHESLRNSTRIFVRELCRRDGKLNAAVAQDGFIALHGVLTVVPRMINVHALVSIFNSTKAADYVSKNAASFSKVDFQKITTGELQHMPVPIAALSPSDRSALALGPPSKQERSLCRRLITLGRRLSQTRKNNARAEELRAQANEIVSAMYALPEEGADA